MSCVLPTAGTRDLPEPPIGIAPFNRAPLKKVPTNAKVSYTLSRPNYSLRGTPRIVRGVQYTCGARWHLPHRERLVDRLRVGELRDPTTALAPAVHGRREPAVVLGEHGQRV